MRFPRCLDDRDLLQDEPLRSSFCARKLSDAAHLRQSSRMDEALALDIKSNNKFIDVVSRWLELAFTDTTPKTKPIVDKRSLVIFVRFYWNLYQHDNNRPALKYLQTQRMQMGYSPVFKPDASHTAVSSKSWKHKAKKTRRSYSRKTRGTASGNTMSKPEEVPRALTFSASENRSVHTDPISDVVPAVASKVHGKTSPSGFHDSPPLSGQHVDTARRGTFDDIQNTTSQCYLLSPRDSFITQTLLQSVETTRTPTLEIGLDVMEGVEHVPEITQRNPENFSYRTENQARRTPNPSEFQKALTPENNVTDGIRDELMPMISNVGAGHEIDIKEDSARKQSLQYDMQQQDPKILLNQAIIPTPKVSVVIFKEEGYEDTSLLSLVQSNIVSVDRSPQAPMNLIKAACGITDPSPQYIYKEPLFRLPPVWSESRQEVCESFEWFRSYQGGVYFHRNVVKGYLLSAFAARNDTFEYGGRLIISHGGGKAESISIQRGHPVVQPAEDQHESDKSVQALLNNFREGRPLVLLIDNKYAKFPYDLTSRGITYAVLGFYMIVNAWAEYQPANNEQGKVVRYKFAFQWCDNQGTPWWIRPDDGKHISGSDVDFPPEMPQKRKGCRLSELRPPEDTQLYELCGCCRGRSPRVYGTWVCLIPECPLFWKTIGGEDLSEPLHYNTGFLRLDVLPPLPNGYQTVVPPSLVIPTNGIVSDYAFSRGWHCSRCGRLSCRYKWEHWECKHCHAVFKVNGRIRFAKEFWTQTIPVSFRDHTIGKGSGIIQQPAKIFAHESGFGQYQTFVLPDGRGFIYHIQPGNALGKLRADQIFQEYQEQATSGKLEFRRWPMRAHKCRGPLLTNYFSQNSGEPYQYVGGTENTVPFSKAAGAVIHARNLIQDRISQAIGKKVPFNEVLSAAYMERQKMAFHSDNEVGLGPIVAGLSLGSPAVMHFRLRTKYDADCEVRIIALSFVLRHGDVLVMDGANIQEFYEHTVVPTNFRIAATARCLNSKADSKQTL